MFRLLRFVFSCLVFSAFVWFFVSVPIGKHTLWQHLVRIARTDEAKDLADGARDKARDVVRRVNDELQPDGGAPQRPPRKKRNNE